MEHEQHIEQLRATIEACGAIWVSYQESDDPNTPAYIIFKANERLHALPDDAFFTTNAVYRKIGDRND